MKRAKKSANQLADWHLWNEVTKTISPLNPQQAAQSHRNSEEEELSPSSSLPAKQHSTRHIWPATASQSQPKNRHIPHLNSVSLTPRVEKRMDQKLRRKIARGRTDIDATLDLHGMRQHEAHEALLHFVSMAFARGHRNILVITGKGMKRTGYAEFEQKGVLRHLVPEWLRQAPLFNIVAGIDHAAQHHGGAGALYVRLKRAKK